MSTFSRRAAVTSLSKRSYKGVHTPISLHFFPCEMGKPRYAYILHSYLLVAVNSFLLIGFEIFVFWDLKVRLDFFNEMTYNLLVEGGL